MKKAIIAAAAIACAAVVTLCGCNKVKITNNYYTMSDAQFSEYMDELEESGASTESLIEIASQRSVLSSVSILSFVPYLYEPYGRDSYFSSSVLMDAVFSGSGVIVDLNNSSGDAYVLTNCHVVYDDSSNVYDSDYGCMTSAFSPVATKVYLYLYGQDVEGTNYTLVYSTDSYGGYTYYNYTCSDDGAYRIPATIVSVSVQYDIALLKVSGSTVLKNSNAIAATFADDDEVYAGESAYAVGNPLGYGTTVTTGVVSQDSYNTYLNVRSSVYTQYREIKTDAAVNGGNSGGGFYNSRGELIGIVNSKLEDSDIDNVAYALAGSYVKRLWPLMRDTSSGTVSTEDGMGLKRPYLKGAYTDDTEYSSLYGSYFQYGQDTGYDISYSFSYTDSQGRTRIKETVAANTTSYGLQVGDVITHLTITDTNGKTVEDLDITRKYMLDDALLSYRDGYTVTLTYTRNGNEKTANVECQWYSII
ncbi:MAG: S1C family serine protease [Clostridia bacterium]|nr:S1C family serine protease [Clostridia bacterium]